MSVATITEGNRPSPRSIRRQVEDLHDRLQVTDRVWHHIDYTRPLVVDLVNSVVEAKAPPARVLLIGSDSLLAYSLLELGYEIELWHFEVGHLTDDLLERVNKIIPPEGLASGEFPLPDQRHDVILLPLILESLPGDSEAFLSRLRRALSPEGSLILATTNVAKLDLRLLSLVGRSTVDAYPKFHVSFSFPPLPRLSYYHVEELEALAQQSGWWPRRSRFVMPYRAYSAIDPHPPGRFLRLNLAHWIGRLIPSVRPALLMNWTHRTGDTDPTGNGRDDEPKISVILSARRDRAAVQRALSALVDQDYPESRYEIIVIHDGSEPERSEWIRAATVESSVEVRELITSPAEGPQARNEAMRTATGDICAHTDDACRIPLGWLATIALALDGPVGVATGPVVDEPGSHPPFLTLPGSRPGWDHFGLYPISNVAFRKDAALASGGFTVPEDPDRRPPLFWDTELAWRLQKQGWKGAYLKHLFMYRNYPPPKRLRWLRTEWDLAKELPQVLTRVPELRQSMLRSGLFASNTTLYFDLMLAGFAAAFALQQWPFLLLALPWIFHYGHFVDVWPVSQWRPSFRHVTGAAGRHIVWLTGLLWGSLRARRLVL